MTTLKDKTTTEAPILLHPPILEAIFEIRWELEGEPSSGRLRDPSYPMIYGSMYERLKKDFPVIEDLPSIQAHPETTPYIPRHRIRKEKNGHPLVQMGPGILTINDAKGYSWSTFQALILRAVKLIIDLYPDQDFPLNFIKTELRYVNGVRCDIARENPLSFLQEKLHIKLEPDASLFEGNLVHERPNTVGCNLSYVLEKPMGHLGIAANLGQVDGKPAFIQQTLIQSFGEVVPSDIESLTPWLKEAHQAAEHCFSVLYRGELMHRFGGA